MLRDTFEPHGLPKEILADLFLNCATSLLCAGLLFEEAHQALPGWSTLQLGYGVAGLFPLDVTGLFCHDGFIKDGVQRNQRASTLAVAILKALFKKTFGRLAF
ncbi:MAG TPA: hypothetical protein VIT23_10055 [Terrimicrobiaceae bacterium]